MIHCAPLRAGARKIVHAAEPLHGDDRAFDRLQQRNGTHRGQRHPEARHPRLARRGAEPRSCAASTFSRRRSAMVRRHRR
jgi:hypothetical protein